VLVTRKKIGIFTLGTLYTPFKNPVSIGVSIDSGLNLPGKNGQLKTVDLHGFIGNMEISFNWILFLIHPLTEIALFRA